MVSYKERLNAIRVLINNTIDVTMNDNPHNVTVFASLQEDITVHEIVA